MAKRTSLADVEPNARTERLLAMGRKLWPHLGPLRIAMIEGKQTDTSNYASWISLRTVDEGRRRESYPLIELSQLWHNSPADMLDALEAALTALVQGMANR